MSVFKNLRTWQYYVHYVLDAFLITMYYVFYGDFTRTVFEMFIEFVLLLLIVDTLVHSMFAFLPKYIKLGKFKFPLQWRD